MKIKHFIAATAAALLPMAASAATFIIPAAGTGSGANGSQWQSELTLHNTSAGTTHVRLVFHDTSGAAESAEIDVAPRATVAIEDIVHTRFQREAATGAIEIAVDDAAAKKLAVTSRTFSRTDKGEFGQDIPAVSVSDAAVAGEVAVLTGPSAVDSTRYNFGLYALSAATIRWELIRADGSLAGTKEASYNAGTQTQYNFGVSALFGVEPQNNDAVYANVLGGQVITYGSAINNASNDPTFVPGIRARQDVRVTFGVDLDENGTIDVADADHDGVLDQPIDVFTSTFPNYFRIVASGPDGSPAQIELIDAPRDANLIDQQGTVQWAPTGDLKGQSGTLKVRATFNGTSEVLTIPVNFR
jgi:hypothetical protein